VYISRINKSNHSMPSPFASLITSLSSEASSTFCYLGGRPIFWQIPNLSCVKIQTKSKGFQVKTGRNYFLIAYLKWCYKNKYIFGRNSIEAIFMEENINMAIAKFCDYKAFKHEMFQWYAWNKKWNFDPYLCIYNM